jgi:thiol-disulfide isomerase/thioredoxin
LTVKIEVIGVSPGCINCKRAEENAHKVAEKLKGEGIEVSVEKLDIMDPNLIDKYGLLMSPSMVVNGVLRVNGKVPYEGVVERFVREALTSKKEQKKE